MLRTVLATLWSKEVGLWVLVKPESGFRPKPEQVVTLERTDNKVYVTTTVGAVAADDFQYHILLNGFTSGCSLNGWNILFH